MRQAAAVQRQATQWQEEGYTVYARCSLCVPQACALEINSTPVVLGNRVRGRRSVAVWLTGPAVSMCIASDRRLVSSLVLARFPVCVVLFY